MRANLFEILNGQELDLEKEYERICELFEHTFFFEHSLSIVNYTDNYCFLKWKHRKRYINIYAMMDDLFISEGYIYPISMERLLLYVEFVRNIVSVVEAEELKSIVLESIGNKARDAISVLKNQIIDLLEDLNYEIKNIDDLYVIVEKNSLATAVAETEKDICNDVIEYRRFILKGNIIAKKEILKTLANKIEPLKIH